MRIEYPDLQPDRGLSERVSALESCLYRLIEELQHFEAEWRQANVTTQKEL